MPITDRVAARFGAFMLSTALLLGSAGTVSAAGNNPIVQLQTSLGTIVLELDAAAAPGTVENFVQYVRDGYYDGTIFHRVIDNFMAQGGGFNANMEKKDTRDPIQNEADNGLVNDRGTIAMARTPDPHSASAQFFINLKDNDFLNHTAKDQRGWGYAVFGKVTEGMDVIDAMATVETAQKGSYGDVPVETIMIEKASIIE